MKIALVARHIMPPVSEAEQHCASAYCDEQAAYIRHFGQALAGLGHHVAIYVRRDTAGLPDAASLGRGLSVQYVPAGPEKQVPDNELTSHLGTFGSQLAARWKQAKPDVVHAFDWTSGVAALVATQDSNIPVVQTFSSLGIAEQRLAGGGKPGAARVRMESCLARGVTAVLATSQEEAGDLARLGVPGSRVTVVPGGIDPKRFSPAAGSRRRPGAVTRLLYIGSLESRQSTDALIRVVAEAPGTELVLACDKDPASLEADPDYRKLGKLAAQLGVADRVSFSGRVQAAELPALLRSADLLVSTERHVPFGLPAIAAMGCGTAVLAYDTGAHADAVIDGTTGVLVPPGRPDLLARRLRDLLSEPMRLMAYGIASADRAQSRYGWKRLAGDAVTAYRRGLSLMPDQAHRKAPSSQAKASLRAA